MKKVLYIEDDLDMAFVMELALEERFEVMILNDANDVSKKTDLFRPDLILIDNYIGLIQAEEIMKAIRGSKISAEIPFILCSAHADIKGIAKKIAANGYIEKPFELKDLYQIIDEILSKSYVNQVR
jgi:DNA-binding NtrC family response regulator